MTREELGPLPEIKLIHALNAYPNGDIESARQAFRAGVPDWKARFVRAHPAPHGEPGSEQAREHYRKLYAVVDTLEDYFTTGLPERRVKENAGVAPNTLRGKPKR